MRGAWELDLSDIETPRGSDRLPLLLSLLLRHKRELVAGIAGCGLQGRRDGEVRPEEDRLLREDGARVDAHLAAYLLEGAAQGAEPVLRLGHPHCRRRVRGSRIALPPSLLPLSL
ncbi:hypothetical protein CRG98_028854 [Punica granatum]|nr:hypothetical protein CRG98_028854 [Punica granatum]